jgi:hypothetical protein
MKIELRKLSEKVEPRSNNAIAAGPPVLTR